MDPSAHPPDAAAATGGRNSLTLPIAFGLAAAGLIAYALTLAFAWDEGFHLLAAQLIAHGQRPYLDFVFAQTPLNAYVNAAVVSVFGASWRAIHVTAALFTLAAAWLAAGFARQRAGDRATPAALMALCLFVLNPVTVEFGTIGQAYGICLFTAVAAFHCAVLGVETGRISMTAAAGALAGLGALSSLLTAPVPAVLALWVLFAGGAGRWRQTAALMAGGIVPALPVLWLMLQGPDQVIFGMFRYHMFYRQSGWEGAAEHNRDVFLALFTSIPALVLAGAALGGIWLLIAERRRAKLKEPFPADDASGQDGVPEEGKTPDAASAYVLCALLAAAQAAHVSIAKPTFERYYVFTVPFLAILAAAGVARLPRRTAWTAALVAGTVMTATLGWRLWNSREDTRWSDMEEAAAAVEKVTPRDAPLYADEHVYFLTGRRPPPGNEYNSSHQLSLPPAEAARMHLIPQAEWDRRIRAGEFQTVQDCEEDDWAEERGLDKRYTKRTETSCCTVFSGLRPSQP